MKVGDSDTLDLSGPSAGQSSVMHALDIFLDIDHKLKDRRSPAPSANNKKADLGFMERMRLYMPGNTVITSSIWDLCLVPYDS